MVEAIGKPVAKADDGGKLSGAARYVADLRPEGLLFAKTLRSAHARARIRSIARPELPDGYFIVDRHDLPGSNRVKMIGNDQPFFAEDQVNYVGEPVLLVVGPDKQRVLEFRDGITVDYEPLPALLDFEDAVTSALPPLTDSANCFADYRFSRGEPDVLFRQAHRVHRGEYRTGYQEHAYLEPQGVLGIYDDGKITVYGSIQCPYYVKNALLQAFGWEDDRVRIVQTTTGGAFGGKEEYPSLLAGQVAAAAYKTGQPVQLLLDRSEDMEVTTKRHPALIRLATALDEQGQITAMEADILLNAGAYAGLSSVVLQRALFNICGVYRIPNLTVHGRAVATNTVPTGAFRGFGAPQAIFAIERHLEELAQLSGLDPLEYKLRHQVRQGDPTTTGGTFQQAVKLPELVAAVARRSDYYRKRAEYQTPAPDGSHRGIGISLFLHGCGFTGSGERDHIKAVVKLRRFPVGTVEILVANTDMGQGLRTTFRKIVGAKLGIPLEQVVYDLPDTDRVPDSGPTVASRSIMIVGKLLEEAAEKLGVMPEAAEPVEVVQQYEHPKTMEWDDRFFSGDAYPAYSWGVNAVEVAVDPVSYELTIKGVWTAFDVGAAIDERIIQGQIEGGVLQGLGYGALEVMQCRDGRLRQKNLTDYIIPTALDCPAIASELIDNPYERGPFGAKGAGELTLIGAAPALAAAVSQALGISIRQLPITPEYLMEAMEYGSKTAD